MKQWHCTRCKDRNFLIECLCGCKSVITKVGKGGNVRAAIKEHAVLLNLKKIKIHRRGKDHSNWRGGRMVDAAGYIQIHLPDHPFAHKDGYVFEHRLVMEAFLGRYLTREEIVHHINENRQDNRIENLQKTDRAKHISHHHTGKIVSPNTGKLISESRKQQWKTGIYKINKRDPKTGRFLSNG